MQLVIAHVYSIHVQPNSASCLTRNNNRGLQPTQYTYPHSSVCQQHKPITMWWWWWRRRRTWLLLQSCCFMYGKPEQMVLILKIIAPIFQNFTKAFALVGVHGGSVRASFVSDVNAVKSKVCFMIHFNLLGLHFNDYMQAPGSFSPESSSFYACSPTACR